jgi:hypothetical protein
MVYARIENNRIIELFDPPEGFTIDDCHHPDIAKQFIDVSHHNPIPNVGWDAVSNGETWTFSIPILLEDTTPYRKSLEERITALEEKLFLIENTK